MEISFTDVPACVLALVLVPPLGGTITGSG
jgi:hypothetical protein